MSKRVMVLVLLSITARCAFNYFPNAPIRVFFPWAPEILISPQFYVYYAGEYVSWLCGWAALYESNKKMRITFTVLFFAELAAFFDYLLRYGKDMLFEGFDANTLRFVALAVSLPVNLLYNMYYGGSRSKT